MESQEKKARSKGGRPKKAVRKDKILTMKCTSYERFIIGEKARQAALSLSEYTVQMAMNGRIDRHEKVLPREILDLTGTINHLAANLNQIARKRNTGIEELTLTERISLQAQSEELKGIAVKIKRYLQ
jgi:hypothetical protein